MATTIDARSLAERGNDATIPVTTAVYTVQFVMNEEDPSDQADHIGAFNAEVQRVMDEADFTTELRYDAVSFEVVSRIVIAQVVER